MMSGDTLKDRMSRMEAAVGEVHPGEESLAVKTEVISIDMANLKLAFDGLTKDVAEKLGSVMEDVDALVGELKGRIANLESELSLLKRAVSTTSMHSEGGPSKIKVPESKQFGGTRSAKELENFFRDMEQYFKVARIPKMERVSNTRMYLEGDAKLWWWSRLQEDAEANRPTIEMWESLKRELKGQFLPGNASWIAREGLKKLKHTGSIRDRRLKEVK